MPLLTGLPAAIAEFASDTLNSATFGRNTDTISSTHRPLEVLVVLYASATSTPPGRL